MKLLLKSVCPVDSDVRRVNKDYARSLGLPPLSGAETTRLAVVGGGCSVMDNLDEIHDWDGDIWAINGAHMFLQTHGFDPWFFSVDPTPQVAEFTNGVKRAIVPMDCAPETFDALKGAYVETFEMCDIEHGPTSSTAVPHLALIKGYLHIVFFGCEGSFGEHSTHCYGDYGLDMMLRVQCDGQEFLTSADMMVQVEYLGEIIRKAGHAMKERSGGLLAAYIRSPDIDVLAGSPAFYDQVMGGVEASKAESAEKARKELEFSDGDWVEIDPK